MSSESDVFKSFLLKVSLASGIGMWQGSGHASKVGGFSEFSGFFNHERPHTPTFAPSRIKLGNFFFISWFTDPLIFDFFLFSPM